MMGMVLLLLKFALKFFLDVLAWPLISLGYPLCASIRAIETNSNTEMQKLITYWILLDLIYLFDLAFLTLFIHWIPFWPYIKLMTVCWLVLPQFDGAYNVYQHLIRPCFSLHSSQLFTNLFINPSKPESFLAMAERYLQENGSHDLQKLIATKSKGAKPYVDVEEIKAVASAEKAMDGAVESKYKEDPIVVQKDIKGVELKEKNTAASAKQVKFAEPKCSQEDQKTFTAMETKDEKAAPELAAEPKCAQVEKKTVGSVETREKKAAPELATEPKCAQPEKKTVDPMEDMKEKKEAPAVDGENKFQEAGASKNVQKEWTCALCQVTTTSETTLKHHFLGRKHKMKYGEMKAKMRSNKNKGPLLPTPPDQHYPVPKKHVPNMQEKQNVGAGMKMPVKLWCSICNIRCPDEVAMASHLVGKKHLTRVQEIVDSIKGSHA